MSDLPPGLEDFGQRLREAAERDIADRSVADRLPGQSRRPRLRGIGLPLLAAFAAAGASAGAVRLVDRGGDPIQAERGARAGAAHIAKDPAVVLASATANPSGGPPWVVRAYTDAQGRACVGVGRLRHGVFGQVQNGRFRPLPASVPGTCPEPDTRGPIVAVARRASLNLTLVYGLAVDRNPLTVEVGGRRKRVKPVGLGAFVAVFTGATLGQVFVRPKAGGRIEVTPRAGER
jgi:hypothetical protein